MKTRIERERELLALIADKAGRERIATAYINSLHGRPPMGFRDYPGMIAEIIRDEFEPPVPPPVA